MSALTQKLHVIGSHQISDQMLESNLKKFGGLLIDGEYAWFASEANIILYSKKLGMIVSSRSFAINQKDKSLKITCVKELRKYEETCDLLLVGCSFKTHGILYICQLPTLTTIRCIALPYPISYITTIKNEKLAREELCQEFKIMSTVLLVGMASGAVFAVDLRHKYIENQLRTNEIVINELRPSELFIIRKNEDCNEIKEMSDDNDCHVAIFINENFYTYCKTQYSGKLNFGISSLLYVEETNTIAIGYSTGHFQLWDCKIKRTIYLLREPKYIMPVTHISFLEPSDDPNNLCYLWVIQSDNSRLPYATMIALTYEERTMMSNGCFSYKVCRGNGIKLEMSLNREIGIGRCVSALSLSNVNLFRDETDIDEDCEIRLFAMLIEVRQNIDSEPESYIFLFDINQWYKAQMPSIITHLKVSNSYASFVKLPGNVGYLDFNISDQTLRPFGNNFRNNFEELYYPSSIYFELDCLKNKEIIRFKHAGIQQEILDQLLLKNWRLLINPVLVFDECLQTNLRPFFWDKPGDYINYSLPDKRSFVISILVENKIMSVLNACAEEWKNGTHVSSEATILHLVQCLWKHVMVVKQYADKLCVCLFDYSGTQFDKKDERILNYCLSQMECVKHFLDDLHKTYGVYMINVDYSYRVYTLNLVTQYFKAVTCFLNYRLLPESLEEDPIHHNIRCDFAHLIQYANKRRTELGDLQLYLIDAIVKNEPKGNKLIEQWQHEGGEVTRGMYPPSNVQCLLRIYLNAALSDQLKNYITIYFLIDVCSSQNLDVTVANRMCNFALEFDVENEALNTICRASWLLDHDMFDEAMEILSDDIKWMKELDSSWDWFHWTVLKLLMFKTEYFWARFYMNLININLKDIDDQKFYINLQIMNNQCFDALNYIRAKMFKEKQVLFEYLLERCKETNKLKCLMEYPFEFEEEQLFFSYLKKFKDTDSLTFQLLFLLQRGKYLEAVELNKSLDGINKSKYNDALAITNILIDGFDKSIPKIMKESYTRPPNKNLYKNTDVVLKCMNSDSKLFSITDNNKKCILKTRNPINKSPNPINLILPANNFTRKRSPIYDEVPSEKRKKMTEDVTKSPEKSVNEIERPIDNRVLEILNTPLVEMSIDSPFITSYSSVSKTESVHKNKRTLSIKVDEESGENTVLRFSLSSNNESKIKQLGAEECTKLKNTSIEETINLDDTCELSNDIIVEPTYTLNLRDLHDDSTKSKLVDSLAAVDKVCEMEATPKECPYSEQSDIVVYTLDDDEDDDEDDKKEETINDKTLNNSKILSSASNKAKIESNASQKHRVLDKSSNSTINKSSKHKTDGSSSSFSHLISKPFGLDKLQGNMIKAHNQSLKKFSSNLNTGSKNQNHLNAHPKDDDDDVVILDSDDETEMDKESDSSSTKSPVGSCVSEKAHNQSLKKFSSNLNTGSKNQNHLNAHPKDDDDDVVILDSDDETEMDKESDSSSTKSPVGSCVSEKAHNQSLKKFSSNLNTGSKNQNHLNAYPKDDDDDVVILDSDDVTEMDKESDSSSTKSPVGSCVSDESDLENTRYGRFKSTQRKNSDDTSEEEAEYFKKEDDELSVEECDISSENSEYCEEESVNSIESDEECILDNHSINISNDEQNIESADENEEKRIDEHSILINEENDSEHHSEICEEENSMDNCIIIDDDSVDENEEKSVDEHSIVINEENNSEHHSEVYDEENSVDNRSILTNGVNEGTSEHNFHIESDEENVNVESDSENEDYTNVNEYSAMTDHENYSDECDVENDDSEDQNSEYHHVDSNKEIEDSDLENEGNMLDHTDDSDKEIEDSDLENEGDMLDHTVDSDKEIEDSDLEIEGDMLDHIVDSDKEIEDSDLENEGNMLDHTVDSDKEIEDSDLENEGDMLDHTVDSDKEIEDSDLENEGDMLDHTVDSDKEIEDSDLENEGNMLDYTVNVDEENNGDNELESVQYDENKEIIIEEQNDKFFTDIEGEHHGKFDEESEENNLKFYIDIDNVQTLKTEESEVDVQINDSTENVQDFSVSNPYCFKITNVSTIPEDGFDHLSMDETESPLETLEVNVDDSTPFLFGESLFGQQEIPDKKPILLFGQVYTFDEEQFDKGSLDNKPAKALEFITDNHEKVVSIKKSEEIEKVDEIQDILELESLPESNPDENLDEQIHSIRNSNQIVPEGQENDKTLSDINKTSVQLDNCQISEVINSKDKDFMQVTETNALIPETNVNIDIKTNELSSSSLDVEEINDQTLIISQNTIEKNTSKPNRSINENKQKELNKSFDIRSKRSKSVNTLSADEQHNSSHGNDELSNTQKMNKTFHPLSQQKSFQTPTTRARSRSISYFGTFESNKSKEDIITDVQLGDHTVEKSIVNQSLENIPHIKNIGKDFVQIPYVSLEKLPVETNEYIRRQSIRAKSEQLIERKFSIKSDCVVSSPQSDVTDDKKNIVLEIGQSSVEKLDEFELSKQESAQGNQEISNLSLRSSKRKIALKTKERCCCCSDNTEYKTKSIIKKSLTDKSIEVTDVSDVSDDKKNIVLEIGQSSMEKLDEFELSKQESAQGNQEISNLSLRSSKRKIASKTKERCCCCSDNTEYKTKSIIKKSLTDKSIEDKPSTSKSYVKPLEKDITKQDKRVRKVKSNLFPETNVMTTRSRANSESNLKELGKSSLRAKSRTNLNEVDQSSSNIFRPFGMIEDNTRQMRVSLSRRKSKSQNDIALTKRTTGRRSKSVAPSDEVKRTRRTAFGLEQIPEEETSNAIQNVVETGHVAPTRKSKFKFSSKKSNLFDNSFDSNVQKETRVRTPRRSKSVQPDPALTLSMVKSKPNSSSNVNLFISDNSQTEKDNFMETFKKALGSPVRTRKRSFIESVGSIKIQKSTELTMQNVVESESGSNGSNANLNEFNSYSYEELSPIVGDNSPHMLFTPASKKTKTCKAALNFDEDSTDESTNSKDVIVKSKIQNTINMETEPVFDTVIESHSIANEKVNPKMSAKGKSRLSISSTSKLKNSQKNMVPAKSDVDKPKRKTKENKETIVEEPVNPSSEPTSVRRMTRLQQSILDKSLQSTHVNRQDETAINSPKPKVEKKKQNKEKISNK